MRSRSVNTPFGKKIARAGPRAEPLLDRGLPANSRLSKQRANAPGSPTGAGTARWEAASGSAEETGCGAGQAKAAEARMTHGASGGKWKIEW